MILDSTLVSSEACWFVHRQVCKTPVVFPCSFILVQFPNGAAVDLNSAEWCLEALRCSSWVSGSNCWDKYAEVSVTVWTSFVTAERWTPDFSLIALQYHTFESLDPAPDQNVSGALHMWGSSAHLRPVYHWRPMSLLASEFSVDLISLSEWPSISACLSWHVSCRVACADIMPSGWTWQLRWHQPLLCLR